MHGCSKLELDITFKYLKMSISIPRFELLLFAISFPINHWVDFLGSYTFFRSSTQLLWMFLELAWSESQNKNEYYVIKDHISRSNIQNQFRVSDIRANAL